MSKTTYIHSDDGDRLRVNDDGTVEPAPEHTGGLIGTLVDGCTTTVESLVDGVMPSTKD